MLLATIVMLMRCVMRLFDTMTLHFAFGEF